MRRAIPVLLILASLAAACGGGGGGEKTAASTPELVRAAPEKAREAGSAAFDMTFSVDAEGQSFTMNIDGAFDFAGKRGRMTLDLGEVAELAPGFPSSLEMLVDGTAVFMKAPPGADLPEGKSWLSFDAADFAGGTDPFANSDPSKFMEFLRGAGDLKVEGKEDVRGVSTTHYSMNVSIDTLLAEVPEAQRETIRASFAQLGTESMPMEVWIDDEGLPHRIVISISAEQANVRISIDIFDYGKVVDIEVPSADDVHTIDNPAEIFSAFAQD